MPCIAAVQIIDGSAAGCNAGLRAYPK